MAQHNPPARKLPPPERYSVKWASPRRIAWEHDDPNLNVPYDREFMGAGQLSMFLEDRFGARFAKKVLAALPPAPVDHAQRVTYWNSPRAVHRAEGRGDLANALRYDGNAHKRAAEGDRGGAMAAHGRAMLHAGLSRREAEHAKDGDLYAQAQKLYSEHARALVEGAARANAAPSPGGAAVRAGLVAKMHGDGCNRYADKVRWVKRNMPGVTEPKRFVAWATAAEPATVRANGASLIDPVFMAGEIMSNAMGQLRDSGPWELDDESNALLFGGYAVGAMSADHRTGKITVTWLEWHGDDMIERQFHFAPARTLLAVHKTEGAIVDKLTSLQAGIGQASANGKKHPSRGDAWANRHGQTPVVIANAPRPPKGTLTGTNLYALWREFETADAVPNSFKVTSIPHLKRCFAAGLIEVDPATKLATLTPAGIAARDSYAEKDAQRGPARYNAKKGSNDAWLDSQTLGLPFGQARDMGLPFMSGIPTQRQTAVAPSLFAGSADPLGGFAPRQPAPRPAAPSRGASLDAGPLFSAPAPRGSDLFTARPAAPAPALTPRQAELVRRLDQLGADEMHQSDERAKRWKGDRFAASAAEGLLPAEKARQLLAASADPADWEAATMHNLRKTRQYDVHANAGRAPGDPAYKVTVTQKAAKGVGTEREAEALSARVHEALPKASINVRFYPKMLEAPSTPAGHKRAPRRAFPRGA